MSGHHPGRRAAVLSTVAIVPKFKSSVGFQIRAENVVDFLQSECSILLSVHSKTQQVLCATSVCNCKA